MAICVGCGLDVNDQGVLIIDRAGDGVASGLDCSDGQGLSLAIQRANGTCTTMTGNGTSGSPLATHLDLGNAPNGLSCGGDGLRVLRSGDPCNGLEVRGNGLYAPCPDSENNLDNHDSPQTGSVFNATGISSPYSEFNWNSVTVHICNPTCCVITGRITYIPGCLEGDLLPGDAAYAENEIWTGTAWLAASPCSSKWVHNTGSSTMRVDFNNMMEQNWLVLNPGECVDVKANLKLRILLGSTINNLTNHVNWEIQWNLNQVGCC